MYAGCRAAVRESGGRAVIHTGFWGCGAYAGNPVMMTVMLLVAAGLARVERLEFWGGDPDPGSPAFEEGRALAQRVVRDGQSVTRVAEVLSAEGLLWNRGDGNWGRTS